MRHLALLLLCVAVSACMAPRRIVPHASPEEAARVEFPYPAFPEEEHVRLNGNSAAAIQLAMDDFLPWGAPPPQAPFQVSPCLSHRESYDVTTVPSPEGVILVRFDVNTGVCQPDDQLLVIATYAIDIRTMRILSREMRTRLNPTFRLQPAAPSPAPAQPPKPEASPATPQAAPPPAAPSH